MEIAEILMRFSLTRQEAQIYLTLLSEGILTGYEVSKQSGISRSNSYTSLASLVEKGAAYIIEDTATRYTAVDIEEFCKNKISELERLRAKLSQAVPKQKDEPEGYITIKGRKHVLEKIINLITIANERIYISVSGTAFSLLLPFLENAVERGLKLVIITSAGVLLKGATVYQAEKPVNQIRLIVDSTAVLIGELDEDGSCLYSKKQNLVDLFKDTLKNEITLINLNTAEKTGGAI
ncbi:MAG: helix-turn-helix domain-containing protein [Oscillospiraceae bacterium]|jgi:sugar-specific transcriptional regulator TrmB